MYRVLFKKRTSLAGFALSIIFLCQCQNAGAQSEEELKTLLMFYNEKDLVISPTRSPKPVSLVAENITVITAKEIKQLNAHTVAEALNRIPGLFVDSFGNDFGSVSFLNIQGSEPRHVLVLVDGVRWNFLSDGFAETNSIPVGIIERIEIIKGPASSTWGSSLGGVVNILTKPAGKGVKPTGLIQASYGRSKSQDYRAEVDGRVGSVGYYLHAALQDSRGLRSSRAFENESLYAKFDIPLSHYGDITLSAGYSAPRNHFGKFPSEGLTSKGTIRTFFATASLDVPLTKKLELHMSLHTTRQKHAQAHDVLETGSKGSSGERYLDNIHDETTIGVRAKLVWNHRQHLIVCGADFDHGHLEQKLKAGQALQLARVPAVKRSHPHIDRWALYANDTLSLGRWSFTPGFRYDHDDITGSFFSPSLGITWRLGDNTIFKASIARGFSSPALSWTSAGGLFLEPNPSLEPETVWSYQAGIESAVADYLWLKAVAFRHDVKNAITGERFATGPPTFNDRLVNGGKTRRQGFELEAETLPLYHVSFRAGVSLAHITPSNERGARHVYTYNIGLVYDDMHSLTVHLSGYYIWWNYDSIYQAEYKNFIWDINLIKTVFTNRKYSGEFFCTAHNIFNGSQYTLGDYKNPGKWLEVGMRFMFN